MALSLIDNQLLSRQNMYTQHQIAGIRQNLDLLYQQCNQSGALNVSQKDVDVANEQLNTITAKQKSTKIDRLTLPMYLRYLISARKLDGIAERTGFPWYMIALIIGAVWFSVGLLLSFMLVGPWIGLLVGAVLYAIGFIFTFALMTYPGDKELSQAEGEVRNKLDNIKVLKMEVNRQCEIVKAITQLHDDRLEYEKALRKSQECDAWLQDKRNKLLISDWRSLRGIAFEDYLAAAFEANGFVVQTTKASGDQGIDLIVVRQSLKLAIQAKGYEGSVGNAAVQEALAGMQYYGCNCCAVITNSYFTPNAIDLASKTNCKLIDGNKILDLIRDAHTVIANH